MEFRRSVPLADGASSGDHEDSAKRQLAMLGKKPRLADAPEGPSLPVAIQYLWNWFVEICDGLEFGGMGPATVTWQSLQAWCFLTRRRLQPFEVATLVRMGMLRAQVQSEKKAG